jgi:hypothetical protein
MGINWPSVEAQPTGQKLNPKDLTSPINGSRANAVLAAVVLTNARANILFEVFFIFLSLMSFPKPGSRFKMALGPSGV